MKQKINVKKNLKIGQKNFTYFSLRELSKELGRDISEIEKLPFSLKILLENLVRFLDNDTVKLSDIEAVIDSVHNQEKRIEIAFRPARVLMQDFTGVPAVVDLAAMRNAMKDLKLDPKKINPLVPVDLVIDHSVQVDYFGNNAAFAKNVDMEMKRNAERYEFLKWGRESFDNFRVVPPGTGICHQVNLENLAKVVWTKEVDGESLAYSDTVVGTDSHTTMINGLGVLGWGVGGIEAEAAMLGQPISMLIPEVVGFKLTGSAQEGVTATDIVLTITNILREKGVVGKFVEFFGEGLNSLSLADRATIGNMTPEFGATCGIFPIDDETLKYLNLTGREEESIELTEAYAKEQMMFRGDVEPEFGEILELNLSDVKPVIAGPKRPQDKILLTNVKESYANSVQEAKVDKERPRHKIPGREETLGDGDIVVAAITSCTNTSNPAVLVAAGLMARNAHQRGLKIKSFVKTSFAPGSQVVGEYMEKSGLQDDLDNIGFNLVGYGCTTCIGNSGPLAPEVEKIIKEQNLIPASVLSGNRNFEGRVHPLTKVNYLASPPLVVAYALAGTINIDLTSEAIGVDNEGNQVFLKDLWPKDSEVRELVDSFVNRKIFQEKYSNLFDGDKSWQEIAIKKSDIYSWKDDSTYIRLPSFFDAENRSKVSDIKQAKILALFGDSITTDHISPAGNIAVDSPAAKYLQEQGVERKDFNSYGARRGNHEVMMRGTFANIRIKNQMADGKEGGYTKLIPDNKIVTIFDAAMEYKKQKQPLVIFAGKEYGTGSSRDWAAKGTLLLGVKAVIAASFERIHRSNLIGMGVLPLMFKDGDNCQKLELTGDEAVDIIGLDSVNMKPKQELECVITKPDGTSQQITLISRIDTGNELEYYKAGGILQFMINQF